MVGLVAGEPLSVKPARIVAGHEPEKTNEFLQALGKCCLNKVCVQLNKIVCIIIIYTLTGAFSGRKGWECAFLGHGSQPLTSFILKTCSRKISGTMVAVGNALFPFSPFAE